MAASAPQAVAVESDAEPIESLPFVKLRLPLLRPGPHSAVDLKRSQDRTCAVVQKRAILHDTLPKIRAATLACCEAMEGKGGVVTLRVFNRTVFDAHKRAISEHEEQIAACEDAIRRLDGLHAGFLDDLRNTRDSLASVENQQKGVLGSVASAAIQRGQHTRKSPEDILQSDQLYQDRKGKVESQIAMAKKGLEKLIPEIEAIETILSSVGC